MVKIIQNEDFTEDEFTTLVDLLHKNDGIDYTVKTASAYIDKAKEALSIFETSKFKDSMLDIAYYGIARRK